MDHLLKDFGEGIIPLAPMLGKVDVFWNGKKIDALQDFGLIIRRPSIHARPQRIGEGVCGRFSFSAERDPALLEAIRHAYIQNRKLDVLPFADIDLSAPTGRSYAAAMVHLEVANKRLVDDLRRFKTVQELGMHISLHALRKSLGLGFLQPAFGQGKHSGRPKWGQPGRGRRRKARLAARRSNIS